MPTALPKFVPPTWSRVTVATPLASFLSTSARHGVVGLVAPVVVTLLVVSAATAPNVVYSPVNDSLSNVSMRSCARAVASVIVFPPFSWRPPRMNIEQIDRSTPARTPMAMTTSTRLNPRSPFRPDDHGLRVLMPLSSSSERAVGARDRPGRRHGDGVAIVARAVDPHAHCNRLIAGAAGGAVDVECDRRGTGGFDVHARLD